MKKLLAVILCVMLFVSVIPGAAFAVYSGSAIDLRPAYEAMSTLNNAYAQLATAVACRNAYDGYDAMGDYYGKDSYAGAQAYYEADWWANNSRDFIDDVAASGAGLSYEGLFELVGPDIYESYENVGQQIINDVAAEYAKLEANMVQAINAQVAAMFPW